MADYAGVGFDLDGTLFDHEGSARTAIQRYVRSLGRTANDETAELWLAAEAEYFEQWRAGRISFVEQRRRRLRKLFAALEISGITLDAEFDTAFEDYLGEYEAAWRAYPDAVDLLSTLKQAGITVGILTNGNHDQQLSKIRRTGLAPHIDVVCSSERIGYAKPDPRAFQAFLQALGLPADRLIFLGDHPDHDVAAAKSAGIRASLVDRHADPTIRLAHALTRAR